MTDIDELERLLVKANLGPLRKWGHTTIARDPEGQFFHTSDALIEVHQRGNWHATRDLIIEAINALPAILSQLRARQGPVANLVEYGNGEKALVLEGEAYPPTAQSYKVTPLYSRLPLQAGSREMPNRTELSKAIYTAIYEKEGSTLHAADAVLAMLAASPSPGGE